MRKVAVGVLQFHHPIAKPDLRVVKCLANKVDRSARDEFFFELLQLRLFCREVKASPGYFRSEPAIFL